MKLTMTKLLPAVAVIAFLVWDVSTLRPAASGRETDAAKRGEYLVRSTGCGDCHTPMKNGPAGPEPDMTRDLSGHPETLLMPPAPKLPDGPWLVVASATFTAWAGPWGISFAANLTSDKDTGLGSWEEKVFLDTIRNGRVRGRGRALLPPMPFPDLQNLTDEDLKAIFAYLHSLPPLRNKVPDPLPPRQ